MNNTSLILYFENPEVARRVLAFGPVELRGRKYLAKFYKNDKQNENCDLEVKETKGKINSNLEGLFLFLFKTLIIGVEENKVLIKNLAESELDAVLMIYENEKRSGGGPIKSHEYIKDLNMLIIEYNDPSCVPRTIQNGEVRVAGNSYRAERFDCEEITSRNKELPEASIQSPIETIKSFNFKLSIFRIDANDKMENVDNGTVLLYIELLVKRCNFTFSKLSYGVDIPSDSIDFVVISDDPLDFTRISQEHKKKSKLMDRLVVIEELVDRGCIIVFTNEHSDFVEMYFANQRVSGGGDIKRFKKYEKFCLIEFEDKTCADRVLSQKPRDGMRVERFYEDIEEFEKKYESARSMKQALKILEIDLTEFPFSFIILSRKQMDRLKEYLQKNEMNLIETNGESQFLQVQYNSSKVSNQKLDECIQEFKKNYMRHEWTIESDVVAKLKPKLQSFYADQKNNLILTISETKGGVSKISIAGSADIVKSEMVKIECIVNDDQNRKFEDKVENLKAYQCKLLLKQGFIASSKQRHPNLSIKIAPPNGTVIFNGFLQSIVWSKQEMNKLFDALIRKETEVSFLIGRFLRSSQDYVETYFDEQNYVCEYELANGNEIEMMGNERDFQNGKCNLNLYGLDENELIKANKFFHENFKQFSFDLSVESLDLIDKQFHQFLEKMRDDLKISKEHEHVMFLSSKALRKVWCIGEKLLVNHLSQKIADFFEANTILTKYCDSSLFSLEDLRYLNVVKSKEIQNICINLHKETNCLVIANFEPESEMRLRMTGTKRTLDRLVRELSGIISKKIEVTIELRDESVRDLFLNERGRRTLNNIENQTQCLIQSQKNESTIREERKQGPRVYYHHEELILSDVKIRVVKDTIDNIEYADVIVIGTDSNLKPLDEASRLAICRGGKVVSEEISKLLRHDENIFEGESHSIKLSQDNFCKSLTLVIVPARVDVASEIKILKECINNSLRNNSRFKSIAFPIFCDEDFDERVLRKAVFTLTEEILRFMFNNDGYNFKEVYLVDDKHSDLIVEGVKQAIQFYQTRNTTVSRNSEIRTSNVQHIIIEIGTILDTKNKVDAIVNTTSSDLNLQNGTVSKLIFQKAGQAIQDELLESTKGGLSNKNLVAVSSGGNLKNLKNIFHIALGDYEPVREKEIETLFKKIIWAILKNANEKKCQSIAMPAFGTGILKYPRDRVAKWMITSINDYFVKNKPVCLTNVVIVLYEKDLETIKEFKNREALITKGVDEEENYASEKNKSSLEEVHSRKQKNDEIFYSNFFSSNKTVRLKFKSVEVEVFVGDIVKSREDVLINPTDLEFHLGGNVSKAMLAAAGDKLKAELDDSRKLDKNGTFWTSAGSLAARKILHVDVQSAEIKETVINSMACVDRESYASVVFPVIGTGVMSKDSNNTIKEILDGFSRYIDKITRSRALNLKHIKVCIHEKQAHMLKIFEDQMKQLEVKRKYKEEAPWYAKIYNNVKMLFQNGHEATNFKSIENENKFIQFKLISDNRTKIDDARQQIDEILRQDKTTQLVHHGFIKKLSKNQEVKISDVCQRLSVKEVVDKDLNQIKIHGRNTSVINCVAQLNELLNEFMIGDIEKAQDIAKDIKWEYFEKGTWCSFNIYLNAKIEEAFQKKVKTFDFVDENEELCCMDFGMSVYYKKNDAGNNARSQTRRIDLTNRLDMNLPDYWQQNKSCHLISLDSSSKEYQEIVAKMNSHKFGNRAIVSIERIQNLRLYIQYLAHKKHFEDRNSKFVDERTLYHGTTTDSVVNIWKFGFNRSYAGKNATSKERQRETKNLKFYF